jgi:CPA1 family monovalent cation:H+ antiporter
VLDLLAFILAAVAVIVALQFLADRTRLPAAALFTVAGLVYAVLPGPNVSLDPHVILTFVIPPLIYSAALNSSLLAIRANLRIVISLSIGLVLATALVTGAGMALFVPGVGLAAGVALGAALSPTDPVAALAVGGRAGLPAKLITIIEGEGLLNDATALTLLQVAVAAQVSGSLSPGGAIGRFLLALIGGVAVGLVVAVGLAAIRQRLADPLADNAISLATPFVAFLPAEAIHGSGVLAVVVAGLWFSHRGPLVQGGEARLQSRAVWSFVEYLLEGFTFLLIGQQLPSVLRHLHLFASTSILYAAVATVGGVILTRALWLAISEGLPARFHTRLGGDTRDRHRHLQGRDLVALSWSGTRGVITLAAIFSVPLTVQGGGAFPGRDLLLFCGYLVVVVTLVGQGSTYRLVIGRLAYAAGSKADAVMRNEARIAAVRAALDRLDQVSRRSTTLSEDVITALRETATRRLQRYTDRVERLSGEADEGLEGAYQAAARLRRVMIEAERQELLRWRDDGRLSDRNLRILQRELDHEEGLLPNA